MNLTLEHTHTLRRLDEQVTGGQQGVIGTQYGDIVVHPTRHHGFCAEFVDLNNVKRIAYAILPSMAFFKLAGVIKEIYN